MGRLPGGVSCYLWLFRGVSELTRRARVVHVSTIGATATHLLRPQCEFLRDLGYEVSFVFSPDSTSRQILTAAGFRVHEVFISRKIDRTDALAVCRLWGHLRRLKPDIVHTHTSKAGIVGRAAARLAGVPLVIHTIHGFPFTEGQNRFKYCVYATIERWAGKLTDVLLSQSLEDVRTAQDLQIKARHGYPIYIGNGVDIRCFDPSRFAGAKDAIRSELGVRHSPVITIIARQTVEKGYADLVRALARISDMSWTALFVGPDEGASDLIKELLTGCGISDRILMLGERADVERILAITDIYVLPSYREGVPRSVIEAQAMGVPAVVTNIRGCREVVIDGETGYLVPVKDPTSLAAALRRLLSDEKQRAAMGVAARKRVEREFDERLVFQRIAAAYEALLISTSRYDGGGCTRRCT